MGHFLNDIRYAFRTFRKSPVFVAVAVLSLALGVGANTAIFTLVDQVLLRLLPVKDPQQLVLLWSRGAYYGDNNGVNKLSYPMYEDFRDKNSVFSGMFCRDNMDFSLNFEGKTERISGELVSGTYFPVLGVGAAAGNVVWLVMKEVLVLVSVGIVLGLGASWGLTRYVQKELYGIQPNDLTTIVLATIGIACVALAAGYVPARRATRVDPLRALRWE